jgi:hypothetical protein
MLKIAIAPLEMNLLSQAGKRTLGHVSQITRKPIFGSSKFTQELHPQNLVQPKTRVQSVFKNERVLKHPSALDASDKTLTLRRLKGLHKENGKLKAGVPIQDMVGHKPTQVQKPLFNNGKFNKVPEPTHATPQPEWKSRNLPDTPATVRKSEVNGITRRSIEEAIKKVNR